MKQIFTWLIIPLLLCALYVFGFQYPAAMDIPNHLARAHILNTCIGGSDQLVCSNFLAEFQPISYFFADYTLMLLLRAFSDPLTVGKIALFAMLAINVIGWYCLFVRVRGGINAAYIAGLLLIFNNFYYKGFYAYIIGNGVFLLWVAFWWPRRDSHSLKNSISLSLALLALFLCHLGAFFSGLICYCTYALWTFVRSPQENRSAVIKNYFRDWFFFAAFIGMYGFQQYVTGGALMGHVAMQGITAESSALYWWRIKLTRFFYVTVNHSKFFDTLLFIAAFAYLASRLNTQSLRSYSKHFWLLCGFLFLTAYIVTPDISHGGADVDMRFLLPGYFMLFLGFGVLITDTKLARSTMAVLVFMQFAFNLSFQFSMQQQLDVMTRALNKIPPAQRLVEVNSRFNFPSGELSRVNPLSHFSSYYILRGGALTDGLINCHMNPNMSYFCYRNKDDATIDFDYQFKGLPYLDSGDIRRLSERFNYVLVVEPESQLVEERLPASEFERIFHEGDVYVLKTSRM